MEEPGGETGRESWNWGNVTGERVGSGDFTVPVCVPFLGDTAPHCKAPSAQFKILGQLSSHAFPLWTPGAWSTVSYLCCCHSFCLSS